MLQANQDHKQLINRLKRGIQPYMVRSSSISDVSTTAGGSSQTLSSCPPQTSITTSLASTRFHDKGELDFERELERLSECLPLSAASENFDALLDEDEEWMRELGLTMEDIRPTTPPKPRQLKKTITDELRELGIETLPKQRSGMTTS